MTADLAPAPAPAYAVLTETPDVLCVSVTYAASHLAELLRHVDEGGFCLIRDGRAPRRQYWLSGQVPSWWTHMDDTPLVEAAITRRLREQHQAHDGQAHDGQAHD